MTSPSNPPASVTPASHATATKPSRPRHRGEFWAVRIGIFLLVALAALQAHARYGYEMSLKRLQDRLSTEEQSGQSLLVSDLSGYIVGFPSRTEIKDRHWTQIRFTWRGLTESYEIHLPYDSSEAAPVVLSLFTANPPPEEPKPTLAGDDAAPAPPTMGMSMGGGGPGGGGPEGGGGRRFDLMDSDKDQDGKISKEEAPERVATGFAEWDTNSDGFIDADEIAARRARRQAEGGRGPGGEPGGGRPEGEPAAEATPRRPASE
jgi:hypothetical protein